MNFDNWYILKTKNGLIAAGILKTESKLMYEFELSVVQEDVGIAKTSCVKEGWIDPPDSDFHAFSGLFSVFVNKNGNSNIKIIREIDNTHPIPFEKIREIVDEIKKENKK